MEWLTQHMGTLLTVVFFVGFSSIVLWAYLPSNKKKLQEQAKIPFKEQDNG